MSKIGFYPHEIEPVCHENLQVCVTSLIILIEGIILDSSFPPKFNQRSVSSGTNPT